MTTEPKSCSCRAGNIRLLTDIQRLTGDLIELEHKVRNMTIEDIPETIRAQITSGLVCAYCEGEFTRLPSILIDDVPDTVRNTIAAEALEDYLNTDYATGHSYQEELRLRDRIASLRGDKL